MFHIVVVEGVGISGAKQNKICLLTCDPTHTGWHVQARAYKLCNTIHRRNREAQTQIGQHKQLENQNREGQMKTNRLEKKGNGLEKIRLEKK